MLIKIEKQKYIVTGHDKTTRLDPIGPVNLEFGVKIRSLTLDDRNTDVFFNLFFLDTGLG